VVLAAFPELQAKFQKLIEEKVAAAEDAVNRIADGLKKAVTALLDALGEFLDKALGLLEKGLLLVVDAVAATVNGIIKAAEAVAKALGTFLALIRDIAAVPAAPAGIRHPEVGCACGSSGDPASGGWPGGQGDGAHAVGERGGRSGNVASPLLLLRRGRARLRRLLVAKDPASPDRDGRTLAWLKVKVPHYREGARGLGDEAGRIAADTEAGLG
jgi:hypothetical protein